MKGCLRTRSLLKLQLEAEAQSLSRLSKEVVCEVGLRIDKGVEKDGKAKWRVSKPDALCDKSMNFTSLRSIMYIDV